MRDSGTSGSSREIYPDELIETFTDIMYALSAVYSMQSRVTPWESRQLDAFSTVERVGADGRLESIQQHRDGSDHLQHVQVGQNHVARCSESIVSPETHQSGDVAEAQAFT